MKNISYIRGIKGMWKTEVVYLYPEPLTRQRAINMLDNVYRLPKNVEEVGCILECCPWLMTGDRRGEWRYKEDGSIGQAAVTFLLAHRPYLTVMKMTFEGPMLVELPEEIDPKHLTAGALFIRKASLKERLHGILLKMKMVRHKKVAAE